MREAFSAGLDSPSNEGEWPRSLRRVSCSFIPKCTDESAGSRAFWVNDLWPGGRAEGSARVPHIVTCRLARPRRLAMTFWVRLPQGRKAQSLARSGTVRIGPAPNGASSAIVAEFAGVPGVARRG
jgi:hypothetical protein